MTNRIPPSLNWLINKRARLVGNIIKIKKKLVHVQPLIDKLIELESNLKSIDSSLSMHEIKVDLDNIKPIRPQLHKQKLAKFPHGSQLNLFVKFLRSKNGLPVTTLEIANHIIEKHLIFDETPLPKSEAKRIAKQILARLHRCNKVTKLHNPIGNNIGLWQLKNT